jgi:hypothetical protein
VAALEASDRFKKMTCNFVCEFMLYLLRFEVVGFFVLKLSIVRLTTNKLKAQAKSWPNVYSNVMLAPTEVYSLICL